MAIAKDKIPSHGSQEKGLYNHPDSDAERALYYGATEESFIQLDRLIDIGETMHDREALTLYQFFCPVDKRKNGIIQGTTLGLNVINFLRSERIISTTDISALENAAKELKLIHLLEKIEEHKKLQDLPVLPIKVKNSGQNSLLENSFSSFKRNRALRRFFRDKYNAHYVSCREGCLELRLAVPSTETLEKLRADIQSGIVAMELQSKFGFDENLTISFEEGLHNQMYQELTSSEMELVTPGLDGTILPGVTRFSILELARQWGEFKVTESSFTMDDLLVALEEKRVKELFGAGTACVVCPIGNILFKDKMYEIPTMSEGAPLATRFLEMLTDIHYGRVKSDWMCDIDDLTHEEEGMRRKAH